MTYETNELGSHQYSIEGREINRWTDVGLVE